MKEIIIVGNNNFADLMRYYWEKDAGRKVVAYTVEENYITEKIHKDLPVVPLESVENIYSPTSYVISLCIGYSKMNAVRERIYGTCIKKGYTIVNFKHSSAVIADDVKMGFGNIFLAGAVVEPFCEIGNGNLFFAGATISHNDTVGNFNFFGGNSVITGYVHVENNCFFGANATVKNELYVPSYVLLGAGAYLRKTPSEYDVIVPEKSKVLKEKKSIDLI
ncbi:hypothetical protein QA584_24760 [Anaerocolumna sp. AGMB13025]|uniref:hypothetical protein n=1 Tax=Anaerocolumna sp. AGMB13025 TaxID=3039116 RepID=UPI00241C1387|nr:hypothetical protein [Anaerocolumna sp. AGMB13025]WFR56786.1 hypothetical protein QA584_24760 [Anaerocolumna sp. AGMB13025]